MKTILWIVVILFPLSEIGLGYWKRADRGSTRSEDQGSLRLLWFIIGASIGLAIVFQSIGIGRLQGSLTIYRALALGLLLGGLAIRWSSIMTLGRLFTVDVAIHRDHALVDHGLYKYLRHPSYTGLLMAFLGLGFSFANWLSLAAIVVPITLAVLNRISKEEAVLRQALGEAYTAYCTRTKRLLPGVL
ncbi:MAG: isoprenylcysteine carboxylmethyltransferase family protein [Acidobacteriia bacterium]|nr:isoprenylcysteine carboxylmethyltransferase family protein [Terriglobia bacterium]